MTILSTFLLVWLLCVIASQALYVAIGRFTLHRFDWSSIKTNIVELSPLAILVCVAFVAGTIRCVCFALLNGVNSVVFAAEIREAERHVNAAMAAIFARHQDAGGDHESGFDYIRPNDHNKPSLN